MSSGVAVASLRNVVVTLNGFPALADLDVDLRHGELTVLEGPNGAGKTTLLRTLAGLLPIAFGTTATVLGHDLRADRRELRRSVGVLGHTNALYDDLTVADNVRFAVQAARGDLNRIDNALQQLGLDGRLRNLRVGSCSAGQRRRTAFAALVVRQPKLWLLDEPHAGLDADSRDLLDNVVRNAVTHGASVVLSSHDSERAHALADRVLGINGGHVVTDRRTTSTATSTRAYE